MENKQEKLTVEELTALGGAHCEICGQKMLKADGCLIGTVFCNGKEYKRIPYGSEAFDWGDERCHDCGAKLGGYHHFNCDVEECPVCGNQLISCDCDLEFPDVSDMEARDSSQFETLIQQIEAKEIGMVILKNEDTVTASGMSMEEFMEIAKNAEVEIIFTDKK